MRSSSRSRGKSRTRRARPRRFFKQFKRDAVRAIDGSASSRGKDGEDRFPAGRVPAGRESAAGTRGLRFISGLARQSVFEASITVDNADVLPALIGALRSFFFYSGALFLPTGDARSGNGRWPVSRRCPAAGYFCRSFNGRPGNGARTGSSAAALFASDSIAGHAISSRRAGIKRDAPLSIDGRR